MRFRPGSTQDLGCTDTSDPGHFGVTEVSRHFGTGAEVSYGHFGTRQYLHWSPITLHIMQRLYPWIADNNFKFNSSGLYRAALSLGGELQSLILTMSSCSAPCSTAGGRAEITRRAWLQTGCRVTDQLENGGRQRINASASNTRELTEWRSDVNTYDNYSIWTE